jgi:hypothetical protein
LTQPDLGQRGEQWLCRGGEELDPVALHGHPATMLEALAPRLTREEGAEVRNHPRRVR